ncbi:MAG: hypothetical protein J2P49_09530 [Methylocapsa sp.]|nr:hypothetical protein [Methylocapsa sp.]
MTALSRVLMGTILGAGALALSAGGASADIVCKGNICWHTQEVYEYPPDAHVIIHPDGWHWGRGEHYVWREHEGPGYWDGDEWVED